MENNINYENYQWRESSFKALIPFIVFVVFYFGFSVALRDFSKISMTVAFIISSATALILNHKEKLSKKIEIFATGMGNKDIMIMCLIFIMAGAFAASANAVGGVDSAVLIAQAYIPSKFMVLGLFLISSLISLSIGTSCGTIAAIVPIAVSISNSLSINPSFVIGAVVGGAMFGDNMSLISDTKIAASRTQNVKIKDEMFFNLKIITVPAILCILLYTLPIFATNSTIQNLSIDFSSYIKVIPYILLLILGISGINVMFLLFFGTVLNIIIGIYYNVFNIFDALEAVGIGTTSMANTLIVALLAGGMLQLVRYNGGINYILNSTSHFIKNKRLCEVGLCFMVGIINLFTANNTVAIITAGSIAKEMAEKYGVDKRRCASLLDTTSCCVQGAIPYGAQILIATSLATSISISSIEIIKGLYYPMLMGIGLIVSVAFAKK